MEALGDRIYRDAYWSLVRAQFIYCRLGLQVPLHTPITHPDRPMPGHALQQLRFKKEDEANRRRLYELRQEALVESGLQKALTRTLDVRDLRV